MDLPEAPTPLSSPTEPVGPILAPCGVRVLNGSNGPPAGLYPEALLQPQGSIGPPAGRPVPLGATMGPAGPYPRAPPP